jgi:hypothetical protein
MKRSVLFVACLLFSSPVLAQPPDVRLGLVNTVTIEADELGDALPVAACFRDHLTTLTPFTLAATPAQADAIVRFYSLGPFAFGLGVFLPDGTEWFGGTPLWDGASVRINPNYIGADDRNCLAAAQLAMQLRHAMFLVREPAVRTFSGNPN